MNIWNLSYGMCVVILIVNFIVFIAETMSGGSQNPSVARKFGAMYVPDLERGQYWRLVTAMFIHFGVIHILCNMYSLYAIGFTVESMFGHGRFLIIYFVSGICGNLLTWTDQKRSGRYSVSAGASGAIFGLMGAIAAIAVFPQYRHYVNVGVLLFNLIINLGYGFTNRQINMTAHIGGLIGGFVTTVVMLLAA